jgi:hypothetical protein
MCPAGFNPLGRHRTRIRTGGAATNPCSNGQPARIRAFGHRVPSPNMGHSFPANPAVWQIAEIIGVRIYTRVASALSFRTPHWPGYADKADGA